MNRHIVSYPKSGRTWLRYALHELGIAQQIAFHHDTFEYNDGDKPLPSYDYDQRLERAKHWGKIIYVERDPRDVMVSIYHQITGRFKDFFNYTGTISEFIRDDYFGAHNLKIFNDQWNEVVAAGFACKVTYEDCHADFPAQLRKIVDHLGFDHITDDEIQRASDASTFDNMKAVEQSGSFSGAWLRPREGASKVRRGKAGGYADTLSPEDIRFLDAMFQIGEFAAHRQGRVRVM